MDAERARRELHTKALQAQRAERLAIGLARSRARQRPEHTARERFRARRADVDEIVERQLRVAVHRPRVAEDGSDVERPLRLAGGAPQAREILARAADARAPSAFRELVRDFRE